MSPWLDDFLLRSLLAGLIMVAIAAPMGCLMVWQRLAFLSDTLGHAAVLGVGLGLMLAWHPMIGVLAVALLIVVGMAPTRTVSLDAILFGDLLATSGADLAGLALTALVLLAILVRRWRAFVAIAVSREIAQAEGIPVRRMQLLMYGMIALLVAVMMQVMGVLLIAAMLVIPTTSARLFSASPERMVALSAGFGLAALGGGLASSWHFDWQTGPAIVVNATFWLLAAVAHRDRYGRRQRLIISIEKSRQ